MNIFDFDKYKYDFLNPTEFFNQMESIKELALDDEDVIIVTSPTNKLYTFAVTIFTQTNTENSYAELFTTSPRDVSMKTEYFYYKKNLAIATAYCKLMGMPIPVKYTRILNDIGDYKYGEYLAIFLKDSDKPYTQYVAEDEFFSTHYYLKKELEEDNIDRILVLDYD